MSDPVSDGTPILSLRGVERTYTADVETPLQVLRGVDLDVHAGEVVGLIGPSGSGKSSLLHAAGLLERPTKGEVRFQGADCTPMNDRQRTHLRLSSIGFVYQFHQLLQELTARDNVMLPLLIAMAPKTRGGARLKAELEALGCEVGESAKAHHRICHCARPSHPHAIDAAIEAGALRLERSLGLWTQPGLFSWDRIDPGSALLARSGDPFSGAGADVGCGYGALSIAALANTSVTSLALIDIDRRAVDAAKRNVTDPRATFHHADARDALPVLGALDFVVVNPPFHAGGREDRGLGQDLVAAAAKALRRGGVCRVVANVALPYEAAMAADFASIRLVAREGGFKVIEGRR